MKTCLALATASFYFSFSFGLSVFVDLASSTVFELTSSLSTSAWSSFA